MLLNNNNPQISMNCLPDFAWFFPARKKNITGRDKFNFLDWLNSDIVFFCLLYSIIKYFNSTLDSFYSWQDVYEKKQDSNRGLPGTTTVIFRSMMRNQRLGSVFFCDLIDGHIWIRWFVWIFGNLSSWIFCSRNFVSGRISSELGMMNGISSDNGNNE